MEKRIKYSQFQQVKSAAKMIDPLKRKMAPLKKKIEALVAEYKGYQTQIDALEAGIVNVFGFHVDQLVKKVIEPTDKTDPKTGKPVMVTKYRETDIVRYDEQRKEYVVSTDDEQKALTPAPEEQQEQHEEALEVEQEAAPEASEEAPVETNPFA